MPNPTPQEIWENLSPGRRSVAQEIAHAALEGANHETSIANEHNAAVAVAYKLWFLPWEGRSRAHESWTTKWPTEPGWYWTCIPDAYTPHQQKMRPTAAVIAGTPPHTNVVYLREGSFFFKAEQQHAVWWLPLSTPNTPTT